MGSPIDEKIRESHQRQFDYIQWRGINAIIKKNKKKSELIQVDGQQKRKQMKTKDNISINN